MITKFNAILLSIVITVLSANFASSQSKEEKSDRYNKRKFTFLNIRGSNTIDMSAGSALVDGDYPESEYEVYFRIGYKHHLTSHLNFNLSFNKYNVTIKDVYTKGYLSFDLNGEFLFSPFTKFSPFVFAGGGYNASNYFKSTALKIQGGAGFEIIITERIGLKLFGEYNNMLTDELDGLIAEETDDVLFRAGFGVNIYFGGNKKKEALRRKMKTVINSNLIIPYN